LNGSTAQILRANAELFEKKEVVWDYQSSMQSSLPTAVASRSIAQKA